MSLGSSFHSLGPAYLKERSPHVIRLLKERLLSKSVSSEFLRLYQRLVWLLYLRICVKLLPSFFQWEIWYLGVSDIEKYLLDEESSEY